MTTKITIDQTFIQQQLFCKLLSFNLATIKDLVTQDILFPFVFCGQKGSLKDPTIDFI